MNRFLTILSFCIWACGTCWSQCSLDTNVLLQEIDTLHLLFEIEGASNNDLSDPGQGLCKVRIRFEHEFLGDARIFLTSPAGQSVQLVGAEGNFGLTQFTEWDVCFILSASVATPDPGFSAIWSNNQVWGAFAGTYNGSYYPYLGALEDFNMGPVNGEWRLSILDRTIFYQGRIREFELEFCDQTGLICKLCQPNEIQVELSQTDYCQSDTVILDYSYSVIGLNEDSLDYSNSVVILDQFGEIQAFDSSRLIDYPPGRYQICGLSYYLEDSSSIPGLGQSIDDLLEEITDGVVCAQFWECQDFLIHPSGDSTLSEITLCKGDSLIINDVPYNLSGQYIIPLTSSFGCDSVVLLDLQVIDWEFELSALDTLNCTNDSVLIRNQYTDVPIGTQFKWLDPNLQLIDSSNLDSVWATQTGIVRLVLDYRGCLDTFSIDIVSDSTLPTVQLFGDIISCINDTVILTSTTTASNPSYSWLLNGGDLGHSLDSLKVGRGGTYSIVVTDQNGCSARSNFLVLMDTTPPRITLEYDSLVCQEDSILINLASVRSITNISWTGPMGFTSNDSLITVFNAGKYYLEYVGLNGCQGLDSVNVNKALKADSLVLSLQPIRCTTEGSLAFWNFDGDLDSWQWSGPQGFLSDERIANSSVPGWYFLTHINEDGCQGVDSIRLIDERVFPDLNVSRDSLQCLGDSSYAWIVRTNPTNRVYWVRPQRDTIFTDSILLNANGVYRVYLDNEEGCTSIDSFTINASGAANLQLQSDTINCNNNKIAQVSAISDRRGLQYSWFLNGQLTSSDSSFSATEGGWYVLMSQGVNTCDQTDSIFVEVDTTSPQIILTAPDTISCVEDTVEIRAFVNPPLAQYSWNGPSGYSSNFRNPRIYTPGLYSVIVTSTNGCQDSASIQVAENRISPVFTVNPDTISCDSSSAFIVPDSIGVNWQFMWTGPMIDTSSRILRPQIPGLYILTATNPVNGCSYSDTSVVYLDTIIPQITVSDTTLACGQDSILIDVNIPGNYKEWTWSSPLGRSSRDTTFALIEEGSYTFEALGQNGCRAVDTFLVDRKDSELNATLEAETITCTNPVATISVDFKMGGTASWILPDSSIRNGTVIQSNLPGSYTLIGTNSDGCTDTLFTQVEIDTLSPGLNVKKDGDLVCANNDITIEVHDFNPSFGYEWIGDNGDTLYDIPRLTVNEVGNWTIKAINQINGCISERRLVVRDDLDSTINVSLDTRNIFCSGEASGEVTINSISGGSPSYTVYFNGLRYDSIRTWDRLRQGVYSLEITDKNGCRYDTAIIMQAGSAGGVNAGRDTTIFIGGIASLSGTISTDLGAFDFQWRQDSNILTMNELEVDVSPDSTTVYQLVVFRPGCVLRDEVIVYVDEELPVYVPNIFTPNGDNTNDVLEIGIGKGVKDIEIHIYDRWGELVYSRAGVQPGDTGPFWDGTLDGQALFPGVFAYQLIIHSNSGKRVIKNGSITMIR